MDTIETSNLNRQFLFRKQHVGQSKASVAAEAVHVFRPNAKINVYQVRHNSTYQGCIPRPMGELMSTGLKLHESVQGNVKEGRFDKSFFQRFALVLNGLDNVEARRHVNRLCLSAGVPLIESGTEGYLGQVGFQQLLTLLVQHRKAKDIYYLWRMCRYSGVACAAAEG